MTLFTMMLIIPDVWRDEIVIPPGLIEIGEEFHVCIEDTNRGTTLACYEDVYNVLTDEETLEKVLQQGSKEEHNQYKDKIVKFFVNMKDRIKVEDLRLY
jgi:hypothetical protein